MITAIIYLINTIIISIFSYKCYSMGYGKKLKNPFANYLFLSTFFIALSYFLGLFLIIIATRTFDDSYLFYYNILARILFYISALFSFQVPLYRFFPNNKRRFLLSYLAGVIGIALFVYQILNINNIAHPMINTAGIVNWNTGIVLSIGMGYLMILPWAATSIIFISEFIKSRFSKPKSFLLGFGFFLVCASGFFADTFSVVVWYILFNSIMAVGFLFCLAGMFYEQKKR